jgi:hypothetical protein
MTTERGGGGPGPGTEAEPSAASSPRPADRLHRVHARPANGVGGRSLDVGRIRWRPDGAASLDEKRAMARRLAFTWNMAEGIPTDALEAGCIRQFYDAVHELLAAIQGRRQDPATIDALARAVRAALRAHRFDTTGGRRADCPCSEKV